MLPRRNAQYNLEWNVAMFHVIANFQTHTHDGVVKYELQALLIDLLY